jgi:DNA polymerase I-like protein with 3'-5' exonuclease and polymerase domains
MAHKFKSFVYEPMYADLGLESVPKAIGFKCDVKVLTRENFSFWKQAIEASNSVSIDTETTSLKFDEAELICVSIAVPGNKNLVAFVYVDVVKAETRPLLATREQVLDIVKTALHRPLPFMWHRQYDQRILLNPVNNADGFLVPEDFFNVIDAMGLLFALDTNSKRGLGLKAAATEFLGIEMSSFEDNVLEDIRSTDAKMLAVYAGTDAYATLALGLKFHKIISERSPFWLLLDKELQNSLYYLLSREVKTSVEPLKKLEADLAGKLEGVISTFGEKYGVINLGSTQQKCQFLQSRGYHTGVLTDTGAMSTSKAALQNLEAQGCEPATLMLAFNRYRTMLNNFVSKIVTHLESGKPARFYILNYRVPTLRLAAGAYKTGRKKTDFYDYYCPINTQAIQKPSHVFRELDFDLKSKEIRFLPPGEEGEYYVEAGALDYNPRCWVGGHPGHTLVETDYATLELRIFACLSGEPVWVEAFKAGKDLHRATASLMFNLPEDQITYNQRQLAKRLSFGLGFSYHEAGMGFDGLIYTAVNRCKVPQEVAVDIIPKYVAALPRLYAWKKEMYDSIRRTGVLKNLYGFEYKLKSFLKSPDRKVQRYGLKLGISCDVQGLGGIFIRMALIKLAKALYYPDAPYKGLGIEYVTTVHDSLVCSVPNDLLDMWIPLQLKIMESLTPKGWPVPLTADPSIGFNWGETFPVIRGADGVYVPDSHPEKRAVSVDVQPVIEDTVLYEDEDDVTDFNFDEP